MKIRKRFLPNSLMDILPFVFLLCIIPLTYWFEIFVTLPGLFPTDTHPKTHYLLFVFGHFLLFNIVGNLLGVILVDSSIGDRKMPTLESEFAAGYCDICESVVPPRSYHCGACKICILRRDHHCLFTGCCIGLFNYRYFITFLFYMFLGTVFCLPFNVIFLWSSLTLENLIAVTRVILPVLMIFYGLTFNEQQGYLVICAVSIAGMLIIGLWFYFHLRLVLRGKLVHELRKNINLYDQGTKENLKQVLGEKWYLVWLSPFLKSEIKCDGINFKKKDHFN